MQTRFRKLAVPLLILLVLVGGFFLWRFYPLGGRVEKQIGNGLFPLKDGEVIVYETEASGPQDCISKEKYDEEKGVCFFECKTEEECLKIAGEVEKELDQLGDEYTATAVDFSEKVLAEPTIVAKYAVLPGEKIELRQGKLDKKHEAAWSLFAKISPDQITDTYVETFEAIEDPQSDAVAYVHDDDSNAKWSLGVNFASYGQEGKREDFLTIIHEFAHILTLKADQVEKAAGSCPTYQTDDGCSREGSYLFAFLKAFWPEADRKAAVGESKLYQEKPESFLTEYAASSPEEDIAESFALFVLEKDSAEKAKNVAQEKRKFFFAYPELVEMRLTMRKSLGAIILERKRLGR